MAAKLFKKLYRILLILLRPFLILWYEFREALSCLKTLLYEKLIHNISLSCYAKLLYGKVGGVNRYYDQKMNLLNRTQLMRFIVEKYVKKGMRIIDIGCGTGEFEKNLFVENNKFEGEVYAIDICPEMLSKAKTKVPAESISWINVDMHRLENAIISQFDLIVCVGIERFIYNPKLFFRILYSILSSNGVVVFRTYKKNCC